MQDKAQNQQSIGRSHADWFTQLRFIIRPTTKRIIDFVASTLFFITILPLFVLIMLALLLTGQSPFFAHRRIGRNGREFDCLKFRSMRSDGEATLAKLLERDANAKIEWEANRKLQHDPRVTRLGRVLRATSLDEIPQLLNIMMGQMSLVGPRPVTRDEFTRFYGLSEAAAYSSVRPGLTGLWQISGRSETCFATRVALDTSYAQRLSLRTDMIILFRTINVVVYQKGAW